MDINFIELIASVLKVDSVSLNDKSNTSNTKNWDSLMHWEIIAIIEQKYGIEFTMDEVVEFENLGEIYNAIVMKGLIK